MAYRDRREYMKKYNAGNKEKHHQYYEDNKEHKLSYGKEYREHNKEYRLEKIKCDKCGIYVSREYMKKHQRTQRCQDTYKHIENIKSNNNQ